MLWRSLFTSRVHFDLAGSGTDGNSKPNMEERMKKVYLTVILLLFLATAAFAKVNINTADAEELATLPGIGQVKAEAIIKYRKKNGKFKDVNELKEVDGIGDKVLTKIKPEVTTGKK